VLAAGVLVAFGRPVPRQTLPLAALLAVLLLAAYFAASRWLAATNPTVLLAVARIRHDYIDPGWMLATLALFPSLAALWLLLLAPGTRSARLRWRFSPLAVWIIAGLGVWFAAAGTWLLFWLYARHTAGYILVLAAALALVQPSVWIVEARRPLALYAAVMATAFLSYNVDLFLFGRYVDRHAPKGLVNVEEPQALPWPPQYKGPAGARIYFKWGAEPDYVRGVVVPGFDWYRVTLAFYSFFRSDRQGILFHPLGRTGDWLPYECGPVERARARPHDAPDRMLLDFLADRYCAR